MVLKGKFGANPTRSRHCKADNVSNPLVHRTGKGKPLNEAKSGDLPLAKGTNIDLREIGRWPWFLLMETLR